MTKSPKTPFVVSGVSAFLAACCWLLQLPPADTSQWTEKRWSVHRVNHATEGISMLIFALLAALFFAVALYRWLRNGKQKHATPVA